MCGLPRRAAFSAFPATFFCRYIEGRKAAEDNESNSWDRTMKKTKSQIVGVWARDVYIMA